MWRPWWGGLRGRGEEEVIFARTVEVRGSKSGSGPLEELGSHCPVTGEFRIGGSKRWGEHSAAEGLKRPAEGEGLVGKGKRG